MAEAQTQTESRPVLVLGATGHLGRAACAALLKAGYQVHRMACLGMIAVTALYLAAASIFTPGLWLDPLGPLVKTFPAALLAVLTLAILPERG